MWRHFDISISDFGIILMVCGLLCVILGLTRRAHAPKVSFLCGILLLLCGGLMWLLPRIHIPSQLSTRLSFLLVGIALLSADLVNWYKRLKCTVPWQGEFLDITTYGRRGSGLSCGSAVFRYLVEGVSYQRASLDRRFWLPHVPLPEKIHSGRPLRHLSEPGGSPPLRLVETAPFRASVHLRGSSARGGFPLINRPDPPLPGCRQTGTAWSPVPPG